MNNKLPSPSLLPNTCSDMISPYFWLNKLDSIDKTIISQSHIKKLNKITLERSLINNFLDHHSSIINTSKDLICKYYSSLTESKYYQKNGNIITEDWIKNLLEINNWYDSPQLFITNRLANERLLPTDDMIMETPDDYEFDLLQNNALDYGTLCMVTAESKDKKWLFQINQSSAGWIKKEYIAPIHNADYQSNNSLIIVSEVYSSLFKDPQCTEFAMVVRMGTKLYFQGQNSIAYTIYNPISPERPYYVLKKDVSKGFLKCTYRNIFEQAFKFMHTPYGWGDSNGFIDCSKFLQLLYSVFGISMPRNGASQGNTGIELFSTKTMLGKENKEAFLVANSIAGLSFFRFKGHIMLFIGMHNNKAYCLHCLYKYYDKCNVKYIVNRMIVSDLSLGEGSNIGSFLQRISQANCLIF
ncbi:MAG TPA: SH3 domain-containing protein [Candidatus Cloacimonadota bacterium]|nr:SH3 domain-containing protein [Candidatus Cloacimonadota bacterium]